jgi:hypothetical protein
MLDLEWMKSQQEVQSLSGKNASLLEIVTALELAKTDIVAKYVDHEEIYSSLQRRYEEKAAALAKEKAIKCKCHPACIVM